jgi:hypothetical protein
MELILVLISDHLAYCVPRGNSPTEKDIPFDQCFPVIFISGDELRVPRDVVIAESNEEFERPAEKTDAEKAAEKEAEKAAEKGGGNLLPLAGAGPASYFLKKKLESDKCAEKAKDEGKGKKEETDDLESASNAEQIGDGIGDEFRVKRRKLESNSNSDVQSNANTNSRLDEVVQNRSSPSASPRSDANRPENMAEPREQSAQISIKVLRAHVFAKINKLPRFRGNPVPFQRMLEFVDNAEVNHIFEDGEVIGDDRLLQREITVVVRNYPLHQDLLEPFIVLARRLEEKESVGEGKACTSEEKDNTQNSGVAADGETRAREEKLDAPQSDGVDRAWYKLDRRSWFSSRPRRTHDPPEWGEGEAEKNIAEALFTPEDSRKKYSRSSAAPGRYTDERSPNYCAAELLLVPFFLHHWRQFLVKFSRLPNPDDWRIVVFQLSCPRSLDSASEMRTSTLELPRFCGQVIIHIVSTCTYDLSIECYEWWASLCEVVHSGEVNDTFLLGDAGGYHHGEDLPVAETFLSLAETLADLGLSVSPPGPSSWWSVPNAECFPLLNIGPAYMIPPERLIESIPSPCGEAQEERWQSLILKVMKILKPELQRCTVTRDALGRALWGRTYNIYPRWGSTYDVYGWAASSSQFRKAPEKHTADFAVLLDSISSTASEWDKVTKEKHLQEIGGLEKERDARHREKLEDLTYDHEEQRETVKQRVEILRSICGVLR